MKPKTIATCGAGAGVSLACCFGLLGFLLGLFGLTTAIAYVNQYGDYIFFPSYAIFGTLLVYGLMQWKKVWWTNALAIATAGFMIYFAIFGVVYASLIGGGIIVGIILIKYVIRK